MKVSGRNCSVVRLDSSFAVFIAVYKASHNATNTDAGEQIYLS